MKPDVLGPPLPTVRALELDGNISLYDPTNDLALVLNETASAIWRLMDGCRGTEDIISVLAETYTVSTDLVRRDIGPVLETLRVLLVGQS